MTDAINYRDLITDLEASARLSPEYGALMEQAAEAVRRLLDEVIETFPF